MIRLKIGLDWDDVTAPFNSLAIELANKKFSINPPLKLEDITSWENTGRASVIKEFYRRNELYNIQSGRIEYETKKIIKKLMEIADVYFITAVYPEFMGIRAKQIMDAFPELPTDRIILGAAKNLVKFDIILDDNICNVLNSPSEYSVLMRKPWNREMTGLLSVNTMEEFYTLVMHIINAKKPRLDIPSVIALVGPSGSGKTEILNELLKIPMFEHPKSYTTNPHHQWKTFIDEKFFNEKIFLESTRYGGYGYGTKKEDIEEILKRNNYCVMPLDMCGSIGIKKIFPTIIMYVDKRKTELLKNIVSKPNLSDDERVLRLLSLDSERKNKGLCDFTVETSDDVVSILNFKRNILNIRRNQK